MLLDGLHIPLTTPFYPDGRVYLRKLEHNVERYSRTPATCLSVLTRTGEASLVSDAEAREIFRTAIEASAPVKGMIADVSRDSVLNTLDLADHVAALSYDVILLRVPGLLAGSVDDPRTRLLYFQSIADRSPLPILLEDHPSLSPDLIAELSANPAVLGIALRESTVERLAQIRSVAAPLTREVTVTSVFAAVTRRMQTPQSSAATGNYIAAGSLTGGSTALATAPPPPAIKTRTKVVGLQIVCGRTSDLLACLEAGVAAAALPLATAAPQAVHEVLAAWKDGDPKLAAEKQARLLAAADFIEQRLGVSALKAAADLNGYFGGRPRLPLLPISGDDRAEVERLMAAMRN